MNNTIVKLRFIEDSNNYTVVTKEIDVTKNLMSLDIDPITFVDSDTLLISDRKCSISLINTYITINQNIIPLTEKTELVGHNHENEIEYDLNYNGEELTDRVVKFLKPFLEDVNSQYSGVYYQNKRVFPAIYNPGENNSGYAIAYVPARMWNEEPYNSFSDEYIVEKPFYYNMIIDVYIDGVSVYTGICEIESYSYDPTKGILNLTFTDANGVMIKCLDNLGSIQSYYQDVFNSGLMLNHVYDLGSITVLKMYPCLKGIFNIPRFTTPSGDIHVIARVTWGLISLPDGGTDEPPTIYEIILSDNESEGLSFPVIRYIDEPRIRKFITAPVQGIGNNAVFYQYQKYIYINRTHANSYSIDIIEIYLHDDYNVLIRRTGFNIDMQSIGQTQFSSFRDEERVSLSGVGDYLENYNDWDIMLADEDWYEYGDVSPYQHYQGETNVVFGQLPGAEEGLIALCNNEGFNNDISTVQALKIYMLSRISTIYSIGKNMIWKKFAYSESQNIVIDGMYMETISINKEFYEKPDLKDIEAITNWDNKNIKNKISGLINIVPERIVDRYSITFINRSFIDIGIGYIIRITNVEDIYAVGYFDFVVTSVKHGKNNIEVEGYGI